MSFLSILEALIIGPLRIIFEFIFQFSNTILHNPGLSIVSLSLVMNILVLPLYKRADDMQEEARKKEEKLHKGVAHIKKSFSGDEKMMILQTYYKQNNYKPTDVLKGSVSLLLQIPFFMAAYNFLSNLTDLQGASLGPIKDLGVADKLITIGTVSINFLPIFMTLVNVVASAIYLKGFPLKSKIQIYGMALFFLVFLYNSPAGLVFYWTLNNVFSLVKTIFYKIKNPKKVLKITVSLIGLFLILMTLFVYNGATKVKMVFVAIGVVMQCVWLLPIIAQYAEKHIKNEKVEPSKKLFTCGTLFLTVLVGAFIPLTFISASPQEFVDVTYFYNPLWFVLNSFCLSAGVFLIWLHVFYWLATPKIKAIFDACVWILSGAAIVNFLFFGTNKGNLSPLLQYNNGLSFTLIENVVNIAVLLCVSAAFFIIVKKWKAFVTYALVVSIAAMSCISLFNVHTIKKSIDTISVDDASLVPHFQFDKKGKNVVVIMLDRAMGEYIPYIFNEKPELKEKFDGFTYYSNTISFGPNTNFGVPALAGGYEYTPVEMNKRSNESLASKHNEALKVMPVLFAQNGYNVTVCDPSYANYSWIPDLSIYDDYPQINAYITKGKFGDAEQKQSAIDANLRNFFCFSAMKCMPAVLQPTIYQNGNYRITYENGKRNYSVQVAKSTSNAKGFSKGFMESYDTLQNFANMSQITDKNENNFLFIVNEVTHDPVLLQEPEYLPAYEVDNKDFDIENKDRFVLDGKELKVDTVSQMAHYQSNMAALLRLGEWLDYLRENDVYDNTKIIITSDHGLALFQSEDLNFSNSDFSNTSAEEFFPLLMVKDFNSKGFSTSDEFMTNADVPTLATQGAINNPVNPFTGKPINNLEKTAHDQYIIVSNDWEVTENNGNTFLPARWISVSKNLHEKENWKFYNKEVVLKEHSFS